MKHEVENPVHWQVDDQVSRQIQWEVWILLRNEYDS